MIQEEYFFSNSNLPGPLNKNETIKLLEQVQLGDKNAKDKLIVHNLRLVFSRVIKRFETVNSDKKDLVSIGIIGLIKAIDSYDLSKQTTLASFATTCIDNEILMHLRRIKKYQNVDSLDKSTLKDKEGNEKKIEDELHSDIQIEDDYIAKETYQIIRNTINELPEKEKEMILMYFGFNGNVSNQYEIATAFNLSQSYVSRRIKIILKKLKKMLEANGINELTNLSAINTQNLSALNQSYDYKNDSKTKKKLPKKVSKPGKTSIDYDVYIESEKHTPEIIKIEINSILFKLLTDQEFKEITKNFSIKEILVFSLKLGYINGIQHSSEEIANFLHVDVQTIIETSKKHFAFLKKVFIKSLKKI